MTDTRTYSWPVTDLSHVSAVGHHASLAATLRDEGLVPVGVPEWRLVVVIPVAAAEQREEAA